MGINKMITKLKTIINLKMFFIFILILCAFLLYINRGTSETADLKNLQVTDTQKNEEAKKQHSDDITEEDKLWFEIPSEEIPDYSQVHTFHQAFLNAREDLGAGKYFKWGYNVYTTNHESEIE